MQLAELASLVCGKIGKTDDASVAACKSYLRARHAMLVDSYPWKDTLDTFEVDVAAGATYAVLPYEAARPWAVWDKEQGLEVPVGSLAHVIATRPGALEEVGGLWRFAEAPAVGWLYDLGASGAQLSFISTGSAEITVSIIGERDLGISGLPTLPSTTVTETVTIGPGGTETIPAFLVIHKMTKPAGTAVAVAQLGTLPEPTWAWPSDSTEAEFARIRLFPPAQAATTLGIYAKRRTRHMSADTDAPMVRGLDNALLAFAQADMLERSRQYSKAAAKIQEGTSLLDAAKDLDRNQSARESRVTPEVTAEAGAHWDQW